MTARLFQPLEGLEKYHRIYRKQRGDCRNRKKTAVDGIRAEAEISYNVEARKSVYTPAYGGDNEKRNA